MKKTYQDASILEVELIENGFKGGDAGHGGFVVIKLTSTDSFEVNGNMCHDLNFRIMGDAERRVLTLALKDIVNELENGIQRTIKR